MLLSLLRSSAMANVVCIKHREYDGSTSPVLSCKTCCGIFIAKVKELNGKDATDPAKWLESKSREAEVAAGRRNQQSNFGFNPDTI
jgi:hypothetical protein